MPRFPKLKRRSSSPETIHDVVPFAPSQDPTPGKTTSEWVLPTNHGSPEAQQRWELRASDESLYIIPMIPILYKFDSLVPHDALRIALAETLNRFPLFAGRIERAWDSSLPHFVSLENSPGARLSFKVAKEGDAAPSGDDNSSAWNACMPRFYNTPLVRSVYRRVLLRVKLTHFPGTKQSVLGVAFDHAITDGDSIVHFLRTWSHLCGSRAKLSSPLPAELPPMPLLERNPGYGKGGVADEQIAKLSDEDLATGPFALTPITDFIRFLPSFVASMLCDKIFDYALSLDTVKTLKQDVTLQLNTDPAFAHLRQNGEQLWVSSYEVMACLLYRTQAALDGFDESTTSEVYHTRCLINSRGRGLVCEKNYFGNALYYHPVELAREDLVDPGLWLARTCWSFHTQLRNALSDPEAMDKMEFVTQRIKQESYLSNKIQRIRSTRPWMENYLSNKPMMNSWLGYPWFEMDFGCGTKPTRIRVPETFSHRRHLFVSPRTESSVQIRFQVAYGERANVAKVIERLNMPFTKMF